MQKMNPFTLRIPLLLVACIVLSSCVQGTSTRARGLASKSTNLSGGVIPGTGIGAVDDGSATGSGTELMTQKVELSHLVDPFEGTYKNKLTLPKNFKGNLYLAGLNVSSLSNKIVSVRFNFGVEKQSVTLKATVARAPGIIPKTDIQVLVIDMNAAPFKNMRLPYDLYDYNDYADTSTEIASDPRDGGLYCRGLRLEDDPTFIPLTQDSACSGDNDKCLYSYAKIVDTTLYDKRTIDGVENKYTSIPTRVQVWTESSGVRNPLVSSLATTACLPDDSAGMGLEQLFDLTLVNPAYDLPMMGYYYRGPFRELNSDEWHISDDAIYSTKKSGLYETKLSSPIMGVPSIGYHSMLFPRAGKLSLNQGVSYLGSSTLKIGARTKTIANSLGTTDYVDGCNIRTLNIDPATNESISSCNVNASIEVFYMLEGKEVMITTDKSIKLQLIRPSINFQGKEVLTTSFKRCESSSTCGSDECCFNSRCWSKDLVTQCVDATPIVGNQEIGANCSSDFECSSLCCNSSTGACAPHNPNGTSQIFCAKSSGQQCVSKEFCKQEAVVTCKIVKSGLKPDGTAACTLRCPAVMAYGDCKAGTCVPPVQPPVPAFDPNDCSKAVDP